MGSIGSMSSKGVHSDLDLSINFSYNPAVNKKEVLQAIIPAVDKVSDQDFKLIFESKVPLIKYTDSVTKEEVDLCVNGTLGVVNSQLIRTYLNIDVRYHKMAYFLKFWTKHWKLVGADNGYISSYALQLMIIAFLQGGLEKPVLPNLQQFDRIKHKDIRYYLPRGSEDSV
jgi:DNA polymerase sigma